ncbi:hypothetical protein [Leucobacter manosquensis]|uniref:Uncharacterized protein n=1 Tax=Leucobacter manosquensis TaxID=2810611 RepID=A0ABS5M1V2_9MICO|nr:hypothetical protein [Leucobacter manosquensis]MBS3180691.1 hypothetical protein [Leucobacter manosquensis]
MSETIWVALVAVLGTTVGAATNPVIALIRDGRVDRGNVRSDRLRSAAGFSEAVVKAARITPSDFDASDVRKAHTIALEARFDVAQHLPKGAGQVDRFIEFSLSKMQGYRDEVPRLVIAEFASEQVLSWARGDLVATKLRPFDLDHFGGEWNIV